VINMRHLYPSWHDYAEAFRRVGGVVEAAPLELLSSPSANLLVEPDGTLALTSTHDQIFSSPYTFVGAAFPQTSVPFVALREASLAIGRACYERGIVGHVGVDFVSFIDETGMMRVWAVDLNVRLTHTAVSFGFFHFLVNGAFDPSDGLYYAPEGTAVPAGSEAGGGEGGGAKEGRRRYYVMNELLYHPQLPAVHHSAFFNLCRLKGVSFDLLERSGTVFNLMDSFASGVLGILAAGTSMLDALRKFADCLDFIQKQVGPATAKLPGDKHETTFTDVIKAIKTLVDKHVGPPPPLVPPPVPNSRYLTKGGGKGKGKGKRK